MAHDPADDVVASFEYLEDLYRRPIVPPEIAGLRRIEFLLHRLSDPHRAFRSVHITGTCGKGSTATMIGSILVKSKYKTGLFRSPHMDTYLDRMAINQEVISENEWLRTFERSRDVADSMESGTIPGYDLGRVSLFEMMWAMAALHFAESNVQMGVIEVGVGGRLSATNVLDPEVAVITNVSLDHTKLLGPTERDIALEKAQIIKQSGAATTAATQPEVLEVISSRAESTKSRLLTVGRDVLYETTSSDLGGETFSIQTPIRDHDRLSIHMLGRHQVVNAATAVSAIDLLVDRGFEVPTEAVREALAETQFPGRFEVVSPDPPIILDGAHNIASAKALRKTLDDLFPQRSVILLIGVLGDKDAMGIVDEIAPGIKAAIVTTPPWEGRSGDLSRVQTALAGHCSNVKFLAEPSEALEMALEMRVDGDMLLVTGSLYLVAAVRTLLIART